MKIAFFLFDFRFKKLSGNVCPLILALLLPQDFQLEAQAVYVRAGQRLIRQRQYGAVRQLLKCVGESGTATKNDCDALILSCVAIADKGPADVSTDHRGTLCTRLTHCDSDCMMLCAFISRSSAKCLQANSIHIGHEGFLLLFYLI